MNFEIPRITEPLNLNEYAPEFGEARLVVWVNPPRRLLAETAGLMQQAGQITPEIAEKIADVVSELWNCPTEDVLKFVEHFAETDPMLFEWCLYRTLKMIGEHRRAVKKN